MDETVSEDTDLWIKEQIKEFRKSEKGRNLKSKYNKRCNDRYHKGRNGTLKPYYENIYCSMWLGIHIAERILPEIYENVEMMPIGNHGFDAICSMDYKIDVKSSCILQIHTKYEHDYFNFTIYCNEIADYFLMFAFDNRTNLNLLYVLLIKGDEIIRGRKLNEFVSLKITNTDEKLKEFDKYKLSDELFNKAREVYEKLKKEMRLGNFVK